MKVLLVDDENYILEYLVHAIDWKALGFSTVDQTCDSTKAKRLLVDQNYTLLITDIRMPEVSGLDLLEFVISENIGTKVMILSGYSEFEYAQKAIRHGAHDYLLKPLTGAKLKKALLSFISKYGQNTKQVLKEKSENRDTLSETQKVVTYVEQYINDHIEEKISLQILAELVYLSPPYLSTLYKKETGNNLQSFITDARLSRSTVLLKESRLKISDIAKMVGYQKPQYFDQLFQKKYGLTPQQFRRENIS